MDHRPPTPSRLSATYSVPEERLGATRARIERSRRLRNGISLGIGVLLLGAGIVKVPGYARAALAGPAQAAVHGFAAPDPVDDPHHLSIPSVGIEAPLVPLPVNPDGSIKPPDNAMDAGWFEPGTQPGDAGTAVITAHVDSRTGPGAFYPLQDLSPGDKVTIRGAGGSSATYQVEGSDQYPKDDFPDDVYAHTAGPTLRLITCTGSFDPNARRYQDNLVVTARMIASS